MKFSVGDLIVEKDGSTGILVERTVVTWSSSHWTTGGGAVAWCILWYDGYQDILPWVEARLREDIEKKIIKHYPISIKKKKKIDYNEN
jgi:hypothetical protein